MPDKRPIRPRPAVAIRPSYVSDETSYIVLGLTARKFRECIVPKCQRVTRLGHTVAVELDEAERVMRALGTTRSGVDGVDGDDPGNAGDEILTTDPDDDVPMTADGVLAALGRERVA